MSSLFKILSVLSSELNMMDNSNGVISLFTIRVYLGFLLLSLCIYLFTLVLVYLYTSIISVIIKYIL